MTVPRPPARHLALVAASLAFLPSFFAFAPPGRRLPLRPGPLDRRSNGGAALPASSSGSGSGSGSSPPPLPSDEASMRDLIASLSAEPTDEARRGRLAALMEEGLAAGGSEDGGGGGLGFVALFEETLQSVGREVQDAARLNALRRQERDQQRQRQRQRQRHRVEDDADADGGGGGGGPDGAVAGGQQSTEKSEEEQQLWSLIDMMVQSKTAIKRAAGELGKNSTLG